MKVTAKKTILNIKLIQMFMYKTGFIPARLIWVGCLVLDSRWCQTGVALLHFQIVGYVVSIRAFLLDNSCGSVELSDFRVP